MVEGTWKPIKDRFIDTFYICTYTFATFTTCACRCSYGSLQGAGCTLSVWRSAKALKTPHTTRRHAKEAEGVLRNVRWAHHQPLFNPEERRTGRTIGATVVSRASLAWLWFITVKFVTVSPTNYASWLILFKKFYLLNVRNCSPPWTDHRGR